MQMMHSGPGVLLQCNAETLDTGTALTLRRVCVILTDDVLERRWRRGIAVQLWGRHMSARCASGAL